MDRKSGNLEFYEVRDDGLHLRQEVGSIGRIMSLVAYRSPRNSTNGLDHVLVANDYAECFSLYWSGERVCVDVKWSPMAETHVRPLDSGTVAIADPAQRAVCLYVVQGVLTVLPLSKPSRSASRSGDVSPFNVRIQRLTVTDAVMLYGMDKPVVALLYTDTSRNLCVEFHHINFRARETDTSIISPVVVSKLATRLIPVPAGGFIVVADDSMEYIRVSSGEDPVRVSIGCQTNIWPTYTACSERRWLLGDDYGHIHSLELLGGDAQIDFSLKLTRLATSSVPTCLVDLPEEHVFVGSHFGDSQLVHLPSQTVRQVFTNLGPISDFLAWTDPLGTTTMVTCSGAYANGSLRVVRNGVGMDKPFIISELGAGNSCSALFSARLQISDLSQHDVLVVSTVSETSFLQLDEAGADLLDSLLGLTKDEPTLALDNVGDTICQITPTQILLASLTVGQVVSRLGLAIQNAEINGSFAVTTHSDCRISLFHLSNGDVQLAGGASFTSEISSIDVNAVDEMVTVCLWDGSVHLLGLPGLEERLVLPVGPLIARSALTVRLVDVTDAELGKSSEDLVLMVARGDGILQTGVIRSSESMHWAFEDERALNMGSRPVTLSRYDKSIDGRRSKVFVSSDRPSVLFARHGRISYNALNSKECYTMTAFHSQALGTELAMATSEGLQIGAIDAASKLHVDTVPIGELPKRILHCPDLRAYAVLTVRLEVDSDSGTEVQSCFLRLFDAFTLECVAFVKLPDACMGLCLKRFQGFILVGYTTLDQESGHEGTGGIFTFWCNSGRELEEKKVLDFAIIEPVYSIDIDDRYIVCATGSHVRVFEPPKLDAPNDTTYTPLDPIAVASMPTMGLSVQICPPLYEGMQDVVVAGDLMRSISVFRMPNLESLGTEKGVSRWTTAVSQWSRSSFMVADADGGLALIECSTPREEAQTSTLKVVTGSQCRIGELANKIVRLPARENEKAKEERTALVEPHSLMATVDGSIIAIGKLTDSPRCLDQLQHLLANLNQVICGPADGPNSIPYKSRDGFVDGDFLEVLGDLSPEQIQNVIDGCIPSEFMLSRRGSAVCDKGPVEDVDFEVVQMWLQDVSRIH